jgi:hypothetical protein
VWCSGHGLYCKGSDTLTVIRQALIEHIVRGHCCPDSLAACEQGLPSSVPIPTFCYDVQLQIRPSLPDVDLMAFVLSLACLGLNVHGTTLKCILEFATSVSQDGSGPSRRQRLKSYIYCLRKGKSVYQTVLWGLFKNHSQFTELYCAANLWPPPADLALNECIKLMFEEWIKSDSTLHQTCASCLVHYTSRSFTRVSTSDVDLGVLEMPDEWADVHRDSPCDGPFTNILLDKRGTFIRAGASPELILCHDCHCALQRPRMPKFALANYLYPGAVPHILRDLTPVEESMVALCQARCIMVQLKSMRGGFNVQPAYRGHTIFHLQSPSNLATKLPPSIDDILAPICVLFVGATKPSMKWIRENGKPLVV